MVSLNDVPEPCMEPVSRTTIIKIWVAREGASRARFTRSRRICQVATDDARSRWRLRVLRQLRLWADHPDIGKSGRIIPILASAVRLRIESFWKI